MKCYVLYFYPTILSSCFPSKYWLNWNYWCPSAASGIVYEVFFLKEKTMDIYIWPINIMQSQPREYTRNIIFWNIPPPLFWNFHVQNGIHNKWKQNVKYNTCTLLYYCFYHWGICLLLLTTTFLNTLTPLLFERVQHILFPL